MPRPATQQVASPTKNNFLAQYSTSVGTAGDNQSPTQRSSSLGIVDKKGPLIYFVTSGENYSLLPIVFALQHYCQRSLASW